jgi:RNA polymerase sigma-70 factor (ECF subfamily)
VTPEVPTRLMRLARSSSPRVRATAGAGILAAGTGGPKRGPSDPGRWKCVTLPEDKDKVKADPSAADELWERYRPALRQMIGMRLDHTLSRRVDASDVVQDVLIKASQRLADYLRNPVIPFHLWLRQIARDHVIDAHRRHRASALRSVDRERELYASGGGGSFHDRSSLDLASQLRDSGLTPAAVALRHELQDRFQSVLLRLDDTDREIIMLRHFEQLSNADAAHALGITEAATGMRHLRALRRLRHLLSECPSVIG